MGGVLGFPFIPSTTSKLVSAKEGMPEFFHTELQHSTPTQATLSLGSQYLGCPIGNFKELNERFEDLGKSIILFLTALKIRTSNSFRFPFGSVCN